VTSFKALRRNVGYFTGQGGTIGWLVNADGVAAVDSQFAEAAAVFLAELPGREERTLDVLVNTHHHGDHTGGNGTFRPVTEHIVGHANVPELMRANPGRGGATAAPVVPDMTFTDRWRMELGDEVISARYISPAHTRGDIVVHFEQANVVHLGDLLFNRVYPVIDRNGGGRIGQWITLLEEVARTYPADAIYICGHSQTEDPRFTVETTRDDILVFRDLLSALLAHAEREIAAGKSRDEIMTLQNLPGFPEFNVDAGSRLPGNLGTAYDELTSPDI